MHTSQPQISRLIAQLEEIVGFSLFNRSGSRLAVTADGASYFEDVERMFAGLGALETRASDIRSFRDGRLRVASMPRLGATLLTAAVVSFKHDHPEVMVSVHSGTASAVQSWIRSGACDLGVVMQYRPLADVAVQPLATSDCVAILPRSHPLAARERLAPEDFRDEPFISFPVGNPFRDRVDEVFETRGVSRRIVAEADLGASVCALVGSGMGVSILNPLAARQEFAQHDIAILPFSPGIRFETVLVFPPYAPTSRLVEIFSGHVRALAREEFSAGG